MSGQQADAVKSAPVPVPFSYAQAARGVSNPASTQPSKSSSGAITPAKEQGGVSTLKSDLNGGRWADSIDDDIKETSTSSAATALDGLSISNVKSPAAHAATHVNGTSSPTSADLGSSTTSTLVRDDAPSPLVDLPESAWEVKSQSANASKGENGRSRGSADRASSRGRKKGGKKGDKKEKAESDSASAAAAKPVWTAPVKYVDAPAPVVNPWLARAQQSKAPAVPKPTPAPAPAATTSTPEMKAEPAERQKPAVPAASIASEAVTPQARNDSAVSSTSRTPASDETASMVPQKSRKASEKADDSSKPAVDAVTWPTPDTAPVDDAKKRLQDKIEIDAQSTHEAKGKHAWNKLDFTPSVLFNTPLPGASRRGGKGGGRGGKGESSSRTNVSGATDRRSESNNGAQSGERARRERSDVTRSTSPSRAKRNAATDENVARRQSRQESATHEAPVKATEEAKSKASDNAEHVPSKHANAVKPRVNRKDDALVNGDRSVPDSSASKENNASPANKTTSSDQSAPQPPTTMTEPRKPEANAATNERKPHISSEHPARNHERKGSGSYSSFTSRGRGERGRGGHRGGRNNGHTFHPTAHSFVNGQSQFGTQSYNGTPKSPTSYGPDAFVGQAPQSNARYGRNMPSRASSIPTEGTYPRFANGYPNQPLQLNTAVQPNGMYPPDYYLPATAIPYQNDPTSDLLNAVTQQMEYYFSIDNLLKDTYLRKHMDSQGFVLLTFIAEFKRLKIISRGDLELIKYVCQQSPNIEHRVGSDGVDRLRAAKGWGQWVLDKEDRDPSSQHDGPDTLHQPPRPHPQFLEQSHMMRHSSLPVPQSAGPVLGGQGFQSLNSFAAPYNYAPSTNLSTDSPAFNPVQTSPTSMTSGQNQQQSSNTSFGPASVHPQFFPNGLEETEPDTFTDAQVDALKVVLRDIPGETGGSSRAASSRTFSNGSAEGVNGLLIATQSPPPEAVASTNEAEKPTSPANSDRVNRFLASSSRLTSPRGASRNGESPASASNGVYYIKDKDSPSYDSPTDTTSELYLQARDRALQQRSFHPCPPDMVIMYNFWEHFLVRNFNARMYMEFRSFAMEDASSRNEFKGLNSLLKYFGKAITFQDQPIRRTVAQDYVNLVCREPRDSDRPAFKQLRAAWRDGALNMKNRKRVKEILPQELEEELDR